MLDFSSDLASGPLRSQGGEKSRPGFVGFAVVVGVVYSVVTADLMLVGFLVGDSVVKMANVGSLMLEIENLLYLSKSLLNLMIVRLHRLQ